MSDISPNDRIEIVYVYDPLCGWCYAFGPELLRIYHYFMDHAYSWGRKIGWQTLAGGMVTGKQVRPIREIAPYLLQAIPRLEQHTGMRLSSKFVDGVVREGSMELSSEPPSRAIAALQRLVGGQDYEIISAVQDKLYQEGKDVQDLDVLTEVATRFGVLPDDFKAEFFSAATKSHVQAGFDQVSTLGISGFPCLVGSKQGQVVLLAQGWKPADQIIKRVEHWLNSDPALSPSRK